MRLKAYFTPAFRRDLKKLDKRHVDDRPLREVLGLIVENTPESLETLRRRHRMHTLAGTWQGSNECHVANAGDWLLIWMTGDGGSRSCPSRFQGDWLLIWMTGDGLAVMQRTGKHDELFRWAGLRVCEIRIGGLWFTMSVSTEMNESG